MNVDLVYSVRNELTGELLLSTSCDTVAWDFWSRTPHAELFVFLDTRIVAHAPCMFGGKTKPKELKATWETKLPECF